MSVLFAAIVLGVPIVCAGVGFLLYRYVRTRFEREAATAALVASDAGELLPMPGGPERLASRLDEVGGPVARAVRELMRQRAPEPGKCARLAREFARATGRGWSTPFALAALGLMVLFILTCALGMSGTCLSVLSLAVPLACGLPLERIQDARQRWEVRLCECLISIDEALRKEGL